MENKNVITCQVDDCESEATKVAHYLPTRNINGRVQYDYSVPAQKLEVCNHHSWLIAMS
jgi:hypothetical protein